MNTGSIWSKFYELQALDSINMMDVSANLTMENSSMTAAPAKFSQNKLIMDNSSMIAVTANTTTADKCDTINDTDLRIADDTKVTLLL